MIRGFLPVMPPPPPQEIARAAIGAALGLLLADLILWALGGAGTPAMTQAALIAPFGASAFLIFAVPNSPLAQPWSAVIGNTVSALAALAVLQLQLPMVPAISAAVLLAMVAMSLTRAMHPPGGAVAIATMLLAKPDHLPPLSFALLPVFTGTAALVILGIGWNRATGRHYPFRQPTTAPSLRQTPDPLALASALDRLRLGANLGVEDLARLMAMASATGQTSPLTAAGIMTRDLISVTPDTDLASLTAAFRSHGFGHVPLLALDGRYLGLIPQTALLGAPQPGVTLPDLATTPRPVAQDASLADLLAVLAEGQQSCIPVIQDHRLMGLITRSDLLVALTRQPNA